tara:strand:- start:2586 stop:3254 length:669 start_codon:yes stop_codon:yes gene_type:complete
LEKGKEGTKILDMNIKYDEINELDKVKRLKLINSITGVKSANLIGTMSSSGITNLAIFSSVVHLGSNPPLLGFITRTSKKVKRNTLENIISTKKYTINQIQKEFIKKAHYTSAKFSEHESEFKMCKLNEEYINNFFSPYVKESNLKIGMSLKEIIPIKSNGSTMIVGEIQEIITNSKFLKDDFMFDLENAGTIAIGGLNEYFEIKNIAHYPYVRISEFPSFD